MAMQRVPPPPPSPPDMGTLARKLDAINASIKLLARARGERLTRKEMSERLGITTKTLLKYQREKRIPLPDAQGRWLLEEVIEWESHQ